MRGQPRSSPLPGILLPCLSLWLAACATAPGVKITTERAPGADFARYYSYRWRSPAQAVPQAGTAGTGLDRLIRSATEEALAQKGYVLVGSGPADLLLDYQVTVADKRADTFREYAEYKQRGGEAMLAEANVVGYQEGTLILAFYDGVSDQLVWWATASATVSKEPKPERIKAAIREMLDRLPTS